MLQRAAHDSEEWELALAPDAFVDSSGSDGGDATDGDETIVYQPE